MLERNGLDGSSLPVVELFTGEVLVDPTNERIAQAFAVTNAPEDIVDVAVVGAGPAGLAAAVYAASEGLSTVILDREAIGGQAGTSSRIRNYLGFPRGVSGAELAARAFEQAWLFGATPYLMRAATGLRPTAEGYAITLSDGPEVAARSVVIATGVSYRRLGIPSLEALVSAGVFYGAAVSEAQSVVGQHGDGAGRATRSGRRRPGARRRALARDLPRHFQHTASQGACRKRRKHAHHDPFAEPSRPAPMEPGAVGWVLCLRQMGRAEGQRPSMRW